MRLFQDNAKRTWVVHVDVNAVKRVRSMADFELLQIVEERATRFSNSTTICRNWSM